MVLIKLDFVGYEWDFTFIVVKVVIVYVFF